MDTYPDAEFEENDSLVKRREKVGAFISNHLKIAQQTLGENALQAEALQAFEARPHQQDAWASLWQAREDGATKGLLRLATGLGKTPIAILDYAKFRQDYRTAKKTPRALFVVHQNNILDQASDSFQEFMPDASRTRYSSKQQTLPESDITLTTFQTLRSSTSKFPPDYFDYIIYDEAHHIEAHTYKKVVDYFQPIFQLGLTATPHRMDTRDITDHFGTPLYTKTLPEAIREKLLADVTYSVMFDDAVKEAIDSHFSPRSTSELRALFESSLRNDEIVRKIKDEQATIRQAEGTDTVKTIVFCEDIEHSDKIAELMNGESYHSRIPKKMQQDIFRNFTKGEFETITVRDMFNEGVNIPEARLIVFLRSTQSKPVFEQQLGRGLRKTDRKKQVTVMDFVANIDRLLALEDLWTKVFVDSNSGTVDLGSGLRLGDETTQFIFDKRVIALLDEYKKLLAQEAGIAWSKFTDQDIVNLALQISPHKPMSISAIETQSRKEFPGYKTIKDRFGSMPQFQRACGFDVPNWQAISNEELVRIALDISPDNPLLISDMEILTDMEFPSSTHIMRRFGSIREFQQACGFDVKKNTVWSHVSNDELIRMALTVSPAVTLKRADMESLDRDVFPSTSYIVKRFGSLTEFHRQCGFTKQDWNEYNKQDLVELALSISPNKPFNEAVWQELDDEQFPGKKLIVEKFGSVRQFKVECGFKVKPQWATYPDEALIALAKKLVPPNGAVTSPMFEHFDEFTFPSEVYLSKRFGGIVRFRRLCGAETPVQWYKLSNDEIVKRALAISPDRPLMLDDLKQYDAQTLPSYNVIYNRFGSFPNFHRACGFDVLDKPDWTSLTNEDIVQLARKISPNERLTKNKIFSLPKNLFPAPTTIRERFGSQSAFYRACGFDDLRDRNLK